MDEDHPGEDEEVEEPYDVERILEVKDNQEVSVCVFFLGKLCTDKDNQEVSVFSHDKLRV